VRLPASCDSAIRRLGFDFDINEIVINVRDKESYIHASPWEVSSQQSVCVCVCAALSDRIAIKRGCYCSKKLPYLIVVATPPHPKYSLRRSL
jgi:hypothetical protein